jgi:drug/metabolite transporter (DMT)-like permease
LAAVVLATTVFSWGFILVKALALPAAALAFCRVAIGATVLSSVALLLRVPWPRQWRPLLGAGLAFGCHQLLFVAATQLTSVAIVTLIGAMQPLLVALVSRRAVGERVAPQLFAYAVLAVAGVAVVLQANLHDQSRTLAGDVLACINVVVFTGYFLFAKRAMVAGAPVLTFTASFLAISLIVLTPVMLFTAPVAPDGRQLALLALLALGPGNGHLLLNWAHPRISAALSSLVLAGVPLLASTWAYFVFGEPLTWRHMTGIALVVVAVEAGRRADKLQASR